MERAGYMNYSIEVSERFEKEFKKLDKYTQKMIKAWIEKNLSNTENPRVFGKGLSADKAGLWRYRIGDYRLICEIIDKKLVILALTIGHRKEIYKNI
ncbi:type II toxin-antitoxin system RelE/ParE family toxin [uncultured Brachyspira sp.]|uniref:type II toxin-antitoxin system RelE family toxin n=1 Tax=uncultured Brachyspira sp. TaxID=221953 RepID=UPI002639CC1F|nr:type II toxin-antitoxin system RelE/ParE family toxin [uncultured Brachyspira sp.]